MREDKVTIRFITIILKLFINDHAFDVWKYVLQISDEIRVDPLTA